MIDPALPGADLIEGGLADLRGGVESAPAFLVAMGAVRLREVGIEVPPHAIVDPNNRLFLLLSEELGDGAHSRYNALVRRLLSFLRAKACAG